MKNKFLILMLLFISFIGCENKETAKLNNYLKSFKLNIYDYKIICIVPVDGCSSSINPSLNYARGARTDYLLVMSSMFRNSIDYTIERVSLNNEKYISDPNNLAYKKGLVTEFSTCYYFLRYGEVIKKIDLSKTSNKTAIIAEVEQFFIDEDFNMRQMQKLNKNNEP